jgi:Nif-specific regulatory protein
MQIMLHCNWPGNVRELENCVERTATMTRGQQIRDVDLPCQQGKCFSLAIQSYVKTGKSIPITPVDHIAAEPCATDDKPESAEPRGDNPLAFASERDRLIWAMEQCGWVQAKAARLLNITPRQIGYALQKYNIPLKRL